VRRFFARFIKPVVFSKIEVCRTAGYQPAMSAAARTSLRKPARSKGETPKNYAANSDLIVALSTGSTRGYKYSAAPQLKTSCAFRVI
jgi:hypothetical protein